MVRISKEMYDEFKCKIKEEKPIDSLLLHCRLGDIRSIKIASFDAFSVLADLNSTSIQLVDTSINDKHHTQFFEVYRLDKKNEFINFRLTLSALTDYFMNMGLTDED